MSAIPPDSPERESAKYSKKRKNYHKIKCILPESLQKFPLMKVDFLASVVEFFVDVSKNVPSTFCDRLRRALEKPHWDQIGHRRFLFGIQLNRI